LTDTTDLPRRHLLTALRTAAARGIRGGWGWALETMSNTLLPLGLLLAPATQLRAESTPIGPGEASLAAWIAVELAREATRLGPSITPALAQLMLFWLLFAFAQSLGLLIGFAIEEIRDNASAVHDTIAYLLLALTSLIAIGMPDAGRRLRQMTWILVLLGTVFLVIQLAEAWGPINISGAEPYEWNRFRGWSENSNGLALVCAALVTLPLYLAETATRTTERILVTLLSALPLVVGLLTRSDAFVLFLLTVGPLFIALKLWSCLHSLEQALTLPAAFAGIILFVTPLVFVAAAPFAPSAASLIEEQAEHMYQDNHQGEDRVRLWSEAARKGIQSGLIGFGPGAHITDSKIKRPPPPNFEAHNTVLDLFTQGGLFVVLLFLWLSLVSFVATCRDRLFSLTALLCGLLIFGMFHLIVRHPIFWFAIVLCLVPKHYAGSTSTTPLAGVRRM